MKEKSVKKIILSVIAVLLVAVIAFFVNAFCGNPVSKALAGNAAEKHIAEAYPDMGYEIEYVSFDFKGSNYNAHVILPGSKDNSFVIICDMLGKVHTDSYNYGVVQRGNTSMRISDAYRDAVDNVLEGSKFTFAAPHIGFGDIEFITSDYIGTPEIPYYALVSDELELDKEYDIKEFGKKAGHLTIYVYDEDVTVEHLAEMLLELRDAFDKADLPFYVVDFILEHPINDDGTQTEGRVEVMTFLYDEIYEEGLNERVDESNKKAIAYYAEMDAVKEAEINM